jgi:Ca2+-binding EF-hand superfamily protein
VTRFFSFCALFTALGLLAISPLRQAVAAAPESKAHKIVYLADRGPIVIELDLYIGGKPLRVAHDEMIRKLFDYLDHDHDGVLSKAEAAAAPSATTLSSPITLFRGRLPGIQQRISPNGDGKVTREAFAAHYRKNGLPAFQISAGAVQPAQFRVLNGGEQFTAEKLTDRLFELLDTDKDGKLSRQELAAAPDILGKTDVDEDEMITTAEVMGEAGGSDPYGFAFVVAGRMQVGVPSSPLHVVADGDDAALAQKLLQRYGKKGDKEVKASVLGLSKEALALLEPDKDGKLSSAKLARFGKVPGDVSLRVHVGNVGNQPQNARRLPANRQTRGAFDVNNRGKGSTITLKEGRPLPEGMKVIVTDDGVSIHLGKSRLDLGAGGSADGFRVQINLKDQIKTLFRRLDQENKGYVERKSIGRGNPFSDLFDAIDRDGDGKITEKELLTWFDDMESLRKVVDRSCISMMVSNEGKGLFELLDTNGDGKLSVRELRNAPALLEKYASSPDKLARDDVPRRYRGSLALGPNGGQDPLARQAIVVGRPNMRPDRGPAARGPLWFQKMDRNRDGDVSRKEFLGTDEQFRAIDTDGDGLISVAEAEAYDKRQPNREQPRREQPDRRRERRQ